MSRGCSPLIMAHGAGEADAGEAWLAGVGTVSARVAPHCTLCKERVRSEEEGEEGSRGGPWGRRQRRKRPATMQQRSMQRYAVSRRERGGGVAVACRSACRTDTAGAWAGRDARRRSLAETRRERDFFFARIIVISCFIDVTQISPYIYLHSTCPLSSPHTAQP